MTKTFQQDALFSVRTFAAAVTALYIGFAVGLPRPYWALATVYVVAHPLTGSTRSKGLYSAAGTLLGASAALALVPNLANAPELLTFAMAGWNGLCLYLALLDRRPRSFTFILAGYTAPLIGFPGVDDPAAIWDTALARTEEILLSIMCVTVFSSVVFPQALAPTLADRINRWLGHAGDWARDVLLGRREQATTDSGLLAADAVEIDQLATVLAYDTSDASGAAGWMQTLHARMLMLMPVLASIGDRMKALQNAGSMPAGLQPLLDDIEEWMRAGPEPARQAADSLQGAIAALRQRIGADMNRQNIVLTGLLLELHELVDIRQDCHDLHAHILHGGGRLPHRLALPDAEGTARIRHRAHGMAAFSALSVALVVGLFSTFWIGTAWPEGGTAVWLAATVCSVFTAQDDPAPAIVTFLMCSVAVALTDFILLFAVLPAATNFITLALALAPPLLLAGFLVARPRTAMIGATIGVITPVLLPLQNGYQGDFASFFSNAVAVVTGVGGAAVLVRLTRLAGAEWSARHLLRAIRSDLAAIAKGSGGRDRTALAGLILDRLGLLMPRLADASAQTTADRILADLRIGLSVMDLRHHRVNLPSAAQPAIDAVLAGLAAHFTDRSRLRSPRDAASVLLDRIDTALRAVLAAPRTQQTDRLLAQLTGIRLSLFQDVAEFTPLPAVSQLIVPTRPVSGLPLRDSAAEPFMMEIA